MKNRIVLLSLIALSNSLFSQFNISMKLKNSNQKEAYVFGYNGSREVLLTKSNSAGENWNIKIPKEYKGILRVYFPSNSDSFTCVSENKDIKLSVETNNQGKFTNLNFEDVYNLSFNNLQNYENRHTNVLPVLKNLKTVYTNTNEDFRKAIDKEINVLNVKVNALPDASFTKYYFNVKDNYLTEKATSLTPNAKDLQLKLRNLILNSDELLETSTLLRQLLVQYLSYSTNETLESDVDTLFKLADLHTSRGQNVLSEMLEVFQTYEIVELQQKYLDEAKALTCTINDRLSSTIEKTNNFMIGATLPNYSFHLDKNKKLKSIYDVKAKYKVIMFWASTCPHCIAEIPDIIKNYKELKSKNIEIIGMSLDTNKQSYEESVKNYEWINDTELKGWYSTFLDKYNVMATPTFIVIDENNKIVAKPSKFPDVLQFFKDK